VFKLFSLELQIFEHKLNMLLNVNIKIFLCISQLNKATYDHKPYLGISGELIRSEFEFIHALHYS
jgi:hypothetical protein